ncbi:aspartate--tRNA ligase [Candidatus Woesearchaeota archaeon]|nr:aspartate--tRNA ligase [Candidatus Woesearchaeota archaeon]
MSLKTSMRTHVCGELTGNDENKRVSLVGWVSARRDHGGVIFIDLRDRYGITQIVFNPDFKDFKAAEHLGREFVMQVNGTVKKRKQGMENPKLKTGSVEVFADSLNVISKSEVPPIEIDDRIVANEDVRMKYRYLDLRRQAMQNNMVVRHKAAQVARDYLSRNGFIEIETPMLVKPTPEGARDYVVPSRVNPGRFYALPQSPQLYKQILMVAGFDRYFQLARCLRDEDLRADRQPEHTQIDIEMSFANPEDVFAIGEGMLKAVFKDVINVDIKTPFKRIPYKTAMEKYGSDKPDLRFGMELVDVTKIAGQSDFSVFKNAVDEKGIIKCMVIPSNVPRKELDELIEFVKVYRAEGMAWAKLQNGKLESAIVKYLSDDVQNEIIKAVGIKNDQTLVFIADKEKITNDSLSAVRKEMGKRLKLYDEKELNFCWIVDFPLFEWNEDENKWDPAHHPFCMPIEKDIERIESDPGSVHCTQYDLVLNGVEMCSGSVRINNPEIQRKVFNVIGINEEEAESKFGFLLNAYKYGGPIHAGFGMGFDRLVAMMVGLSDIREVIAFPKNKAAECPMDGSPIELSQRQLKELSIKVDMAKR